MGLSELDDLVEDIGRFSDPQPTVMIQQLVDNASLVQADGGSSVVTGSSVAGSVAGAASNSALGNTVSGDLSTGDMLLEQVVRSPDDLLEQIAQLVDELAGDVLQATAVDAHQALDASDAPRAAGAFRRLGQRGLKAANDLGTIFWPP